MTAVDLSREGADTPTALTAGGPNAIAVAQGLTGDEWNLRITRLAIAGVRRYQEFLDRLPISNAVLAVRLKALVDLGVLDRDQYESRPPRYEYVITRRGRDLWTALLAIWDWELVWVDHHTTPVPPIHHLSCGNDCHPVLTCLECDDPVQPRDIIGVDGPAAGRDRSVPAAATRRRSRAGIQTSDFAYPQTYAVLGNRWSTAMIGAAFAGARQFKDFEQALGAPPTVITDRLQRFCELGVFTHVPQRDRPDRREYRLTDKGRAFFPVVMLIMAWGQRWFQSPEGPAQIFLHRAHAGRAEHSFIPRLACGHCHSVLRGVDIVNVDAAVAVK